MCLTRILPVFLFTSISTTTAENVAGHARGPNETPRPVTTVSLERFEAATLGCQLDAVATAFSTARKRSWKRQVTGTAPAWTLPLSCVFLTFWRRNATGSIFAA